MRELILDSLGEHSPEKRFLLEAVAHSSSRCSDPWIAPCDTAQLDWQYILAFAAGHSMVPHLYSFVCESALEVPAVVRAWLDEQFRCNALDNRRLARQLVSIVKRLESLGLPLLAMKGPALAVTAYGGISKRRFVDLDLLVAPDDRRRARRALLEMGYRPDLSRDGAMAPDFIVSKEGGEELVGSRGATVDLHYALSSSYFPLKLDFGSLLGRCVRVVIEGHEVRVLSPEDHLLLLCVHACKHGWAKLGYLCDIVQLIRSHPVLDWDAIVGRAVDVAVRRALMLGLYLGEIVAGVGVPERLFAAADRRMIWLVRNALDGIWNVDDSFGHRVLSAIVLLASMDAPRRAARAAIVRIVTPSADDWRAWPLIPRPLHPLYYALRPLRLLASYAHRTLPKDEPERIFPLRESPRGSATVR